MARIPNYTKGLVLKRETARQADLSQIEAEAAPFEGAAGVLDVGTQIAQTIKDTQDMTAVNEAVIKKKRQDIEFREQFRKDRENPIGMAKDLEDAYKERDKAFMESLPSEAARQSFQREAERINLGFYQQDLSNETTDSAKYFVSKTDSAVADLEALAYRGATPEELKKDRLASMSTLRPVLGADEIEVFDAKARRRIASAYINGVIDTDPVLAKDLLDSKKYDDQLGVDELNTLSDRAYSAIKAQKKELEEQATKDMVQAALVSGAPLDPKNNDIKKALDTFYNKSDLHKGLIQGDPKAANDIAFYASRTNYLPTQAVSTLRGQLLNGSNEQKLYAVDTIARIEEEAPNALDAFPKQDLSMATLANKYIRSGIDQNEALKLAKEETDPLKSDIRGLRNNELNSAKTDYAALVENNFDPGIFTIGADLPNLPAARDSIISDYKTMYDGYYRTTGDTEVAQRLADREFKRLYAVSRVTDSGMIDGGTIMKYAPEAFYSVPGLDDGWMREQLLEDIKEISGKEVDLDNIVLIADHVTAREKDNLPTYQVFIKDDVGQYLELRDESESLLRYRFDSSKAKAKYKQEVTEDTESLKRIRKRRVDAYTSPEQEQEQDIMMQRFGL